VHVLKIVVWNERAKLKRCGLSILIGNQSGVTESRKIKTPAQIEDSLCVSWFDLPTYVTRFGSLLPVARNTLIFARGRILRADTEETRSGTGLLVKAKQEYTLQMGEWAPSREGAALEVPNLQAFIRICRHGVVRPGKLGNVSLASENWAMGHPLLPHFGCREVLALDGQVEAVIFCVCGLQGLWISKKLMHIISRFVNVNSLRCDSLSTSKSGFSVIRIPNSLPTSYFILTYFHAVSPSFSH
jgi:hypothetical protein